MDNVHQNRNFKHLRRVIIFPYFFFPFGVIVLFTLFTIKLIMDVTRGPAQS